MREAPASFLGGASRSGGAVSGPCDPRVLSPPGEPLKGGVQPGSQNSHSSAVGRRCSDPSPAWGL